MVALVACGKGLKRRDENNMEPRALIHVKGNGNVNKIIEVKVRTDKF